MTLLLVFLIYQYVSHISVIRFKSGHNVEDPLFGFF